MVPFPTRKTGNVPLSGTCFEDGSEIWVEGSSGLRVMRLLSMVCGAVLKVVEGVDTKEYISLEGGGGRAWML